MLRKMKPEYKFSKSEAAHDPSGTFFNKQFSRNDIIPYAPLFHTNTYKTYRHTEIIVNEECMHQEKNDYGPLDH